ncbi:hypothetical protein HPP92_013855 [Vanilla planifolia]|uniref:Endoplasmic reticulum vesicle transporter C-terminal domain-containing protein n=1 Tax=Vanilla planifolia TaxID=51239 RepID=A0A835QT32_VANPL|nr:hypothetical protein HPP92_013855 [Vanilla planifolia]
MEILKKLKDLDAYPKIKDDFYDRTRSGRSSGPPNNGLYFYAATETKLIVDTSRGERLRVNIERPLQKHGGRLEHGETYCGSCFGAERSDDQCCNSCEEVQEAYRNRGWGLTNVDLIDQCKREGFVQKIKEETGEGCNIKGFLEVSKVAGNFHFACGKSFHQPNFVVSDVLDLQLESFNISHKINHLSFGKEYPGFVNPLDGAEWKEPAVSGIYQYFIKVVPTIYTNIRGQKIHSNQFSVTEHYRDGKVHSKSPSGIYFFYDFSPIKVIFTEENKSFLHFLTSICAIIEVFLPWLASLILLCIMDNEQLRRKQSLVSTDELFATEGSLNKAFLREAFRSLQKKKLLL